MESKRILILVVISLLWLFVIPLKIGQNDEAEKRRLFNAYLKKFNKTYGENDVEYVQRFHIFKNSLKIIEGLNGNHTKSVNSAVYGLTVFSDLSQTEFAKIFLRQNNSSHGKTYPEGNNVALGEFKRKSKRSPAVPLKVDWRTRGIIGPVHNQRTCGACWAFSTIETIEAMNALKSGDLVELSVQEMIDCAKNGNHGCEGGDSCSLLQWLTITKTRVTTNHVYPFTYKTGYCNAKFSKTGVQVKNYTCESFTGLEDEMLRKVAFHGPVAAAVNALNWQYYLGGIIQFHCSGAPENLNHAVQVVGYDRTGPVPYYIVRNSWGPEFGDKGYLYIAVGNNICGLNWVPLGLQSPGSVFKYRANMKFSSGSESWSEAQASELIEVIII
ncbi:hypothetical protein RUM43_006664 [Polyplax serrata]|uniref:Uncharacterized protein n=1 Tax=Polyplax serrata TaxID=468196 RepID=A0AAN8P1L4_POLSC